MFLIGTNFEKTVDLIKHFKQKSKQLRKIFILQTTKKKLGKIKVKKKQLFNMDLKQELRETRRD